MSCCELDIYYGAGGKLTCNACGEEIVEEVKRGNDSGRCVVKYACPRCGNVRHCNCNERMRVKTDGGDTTIVCE